MTIVEELRTDRESGARRLEAEYKAGLMSLARRFCADDGDAEELVNRTLAAVVEGIDDYLEQSAFFGWMCKILENIHAKDVRRKSNRTVAGDAEAVDGASDDEAGDRIFREVDASLLRDAIAELPADLKDALMLRYFMDLPVSRVARILSAPEGTVKWRLHCARMVLSAKLGAATRRPGGKMALLALILLAGFAVARGVAGWVSAHAEDAADESHAEFAEAGSHAEFTEASEAGSHAESAEFAEAGSHAEFAESAEAPVSTVPTLPTVSTPEPSAMNAKSLLAATASLTLATAPVAAHAAGTVAGKPDFFAQWIESNGSTYIDTGVVGRPDTRVEMSFQWLANENDKALIGSRVVGGSVFIPCYGDNGDFCCYANTFFRTDGKNGRLPFRVGVDYALVADFKTNSQTVTINGDTAFDLSVQGLADTGVPMYLFAANAGNASVICQSKARVYHLKIWQDDELVRDFVPGIKGGEGCLYDRVNDTCHMSAGGAIASSAGLVGPPAGIPRHPKWELSYLGSEGHSYVDTGVLGNPGLSVSAEIAWMNATAGDQSVLSSYDNGRRCYALYHDGGRLAIAVAGKIFGAPGVTLVPGQKCVVETDFGSSTHSLRFGGEAVASGSEAFSRTVSGKTLYLFAASTTTQASGVLWETAARVCSLKMYEDGGLVRDYVPVLADNGAPYLYDRVEGTFHQGATSGLWDVGEVVRSLAPGTCLIVR